MPETPAEVFAVDFATLAREIAQDIFSIDQIVALHRLTDEEWRRINAHPRFQRMLAEMQREWNSAANTRERVKIKAATGLESQLEVFISEIAADGVPLTQKVEAGKFLARLGEMDGSNQSIAATPGSGITINIVTSQGAKPVHIEGTLAKLIDTVDAETAD
jgi:cell fate (sporulation/competence/biofilm development) regulator YmcA (YheA/YmcA/DUF963 family)